MAKKEQILELLNAYKSEVDNFNDAIFTDKFEVLAQDIVKLFFIYGVSQRSELFSLAEMKQAFEAGEKHKYECYADSKERKCYCRNDDDCTWRKYQTFEDWIKTKENCG